LHSVIKTGDESIIETTRLDQEMQSAVGHPAHYRENTVDIVDDDLELMIDNVVDRHITALRQDIRLLLERALNAP